MGHPGTRLLVGKIHCSDKDGNKLHPQKCHRKTPDLSINCFKGWWVQEQQWGIDKSSLAGKGLSPCSVALMRSFLELLNICKSCTGSGTQNERQVPSKETARWNGCFLLGIKQNAPFIVKYSHCRRLGVQLWWSLSQGIISFLFATCSFCSSHHRWCPGFSVSMKESVREKMVYKTQTCSIRPHVDISRNRVSATKGCSTLGWQRAKEQAGSLTPQAPETLELLVFKWEKVLKRYWSNLF